MSQMFMGVLNFLAQHVFSQNSHRVTVGVSNISQFSVCELESTRNMRQLNEWLVSYETKL